VTICTRDQRVFIKEQNGYEGDLTNPMPWERTVEKFHWLTEAFADEELPSKLIGAVALIGLIDSRLRSNRSW
jgi:2-methylcitrate dehydratase